MMEAKAKATANAEKQEQMQNTTKTTHVKQHKATHNQHIIQKS